MIWGENPPLFWKTYMLLIFFYIHIPLGSWTQFVKHVFQVGCSTPVDVYFWTILPQKSMGLVSFYLHGGTVNFRMGSIIRMVCCRPPKTNGWKMFFRGKLAVNFGEGICVIYRTIYDVNTSSISLWYWSINIYIYIHRGQYYVYMFTFIINTWACLYIEKGINIVAKRLRPHLLITSNLKYWAVFLSSSSTGFSPGQCYKCKTSCRGIVGCHANARYSGSMLGVIFLTWRKLRSCLYYYSKKMDECLECQMD